MEFLATASGWKDWLVPDGIQTMATAGLPTLKGMRGKVSEPMQRASDEIRHFLEDLLGEQAAAVVMAVGERAATASATPGSRQRVQQHNAAALKPKGQAQARQTQRKVQSQPQQEGQQRSGQVANVVRVTRKAFEELAHLEKALVGEHMVDYHELKRLGGL